MTVPHPSTRWYGVLAAAALTVAGGSFAVVAGGQLAFPGFTESMEGDILQHVERAANGRPIYPAPGGEYIALAYMPLYYVLAAPFYWLFGDSLFGPRLLSVLCAVASAALVGRIAARETGSPATGVLGAAFFCAGYRIMDACLFCALPDALCLFWLLLGYWFWAYGTTRRADVAWLTCFALAFWTKQHGAFYFGGAVLYALLYRANARPRWLPLLGLALGGPVAYALVAKLAGEHFVHATLTVPEHWERSWWFSARRTAFVLGSSAPLALAAGLDLARRWWLDGHRRPTPLGWFTTLALASALVTMTTAGASNNHYVPFLAMLSAVLAVRCHHLREARQPSRLSLPLLVALPVSAAVTIAALALFRSHPIPVLAPVALGVAAVGFLAIERSWLLPFSRGPAGVGTLVACQFVVCAYSPFAFLPPAGWRDDVARLDAELAALDGPVVWLTYGHTPADFLPRTADAPSWVALEDIERQVGHEDRATRDLAPFRDRIRAGHGLYLLTDTRINDENRPVWRQVKDDVTLVREYGDEFARVRQIAAHWYYIDGVPRFLYRVK